MSSSDRYTIQKFDASILDGLTVEEKQIFGNLLNIVKRDGYGKKWCFENYEEICEGRMKTKIKGEFIFAVLTSQRMVQFIIRAPPG
jgi:hypothetical protein